MFMWLTQMLLTALLYREQVHSDKAQENYEALPENYGITLSRFLCGAVMHFTLQNEIEQGLKIMKYSTNHHWKFSNYLWAFFIGFAQLSMVIFVEIVNILILCSNYEVMSIIMDFLALVIISDFDNFFVATLKTDRIYNLLLDDADGVLENALKIQRTSSNKANQEVDGNLHTSVLSDAGDSTDEGEGDEASAIPPAGIAHAQSDMTSGKTGKAAKVAPVNGSVLSDNRDQKMSPREMSEDGKLVEEIDSLTNPVASKSSQMQEEKK